MGKQICDKIQHTLTKLESVYILEKDFQSIYLIKVISRLREMFQHESLLLNGINVESLKYEFKRLERSLRLAKVSSIDKRQHYCEKMLNGILQRQGKAYKHCLTFRN
jgi:hypothetical protein